MTIIDFTLVFALLARGGANLLFEGYHVRSPAHADTYAREILHTVVVNYIL